MGYNIQRILLVDDHIEEMEEEFVSVFKEYEIEVLKAQSPEEGIEFINKGLLIDSIVLDWELEDGDSEGLKSTFFLNKLREKLFIPVLIWSDYIENYRKYNTNVDYPIELIKDVSKDGFNPEQIKKLFDDWLNNSLTAQISKLYRTTIREALEQNFFELNQMTQIELAVVLKTIVGIKGNIDWSNDFILNLIHRKLISDHSFVNKLSELMDGANDISGDSDFDRINNFFNQVVYFTYDAKIIKSGDIVSFNISDENKLYGIVVTPDCDLAWKKSRFLELVEMKDINDPKLKIQNSGGSKLKYVLSQKNDSCYLFPKVKINSGFTDFIALFKSKIILEEVIENDNDIQYPKSKDKLSYHSRFIYKGLEVKLSYVCSKTNPYKGDFLHAYHSHNSRIGVPDIQKLLLQVEQ